MLDSIEEATLEQRAAEKIDSKRETSQTDDVSDPLEMDGGTDRSSDTTAAGTEERNDDN
jgi:hypothetical protein